MNKYLVSNIDNATVYDTAMYKAAFKKESNRIAEQWNVLSPNNKIHIDPLTDKEQDLANLFEQYVKATRENE